MNDFEKIEHLLLSKKFEELSPSELKEVQTHFENATDYNDMRDTLMQVKSTLAADKLLIKPSVDLKEKLLQQFEQTHANKSGGGKTTPFYKRLAFQWSAAASVVILLSLSTVWYFNNATGNKKEMAVNYDKPHKDQLPPGEEKSTMTGETTGAMSDSTSVTFSNSESKEDVATTTNGPNIGSQQDLEEDKNVPLGNISKNENKVTEGDVNNGFAPAEDEKTINNQNLKDNTTLDTRKNDDLKKESNRDDANFYYNDAIQKGKEESKTLELNTTIPEMKVNTVNERNRSTNTKDYWNYKKQKSNDKDGERTEQTKTQSNTNSDSIQLGGYMSVNQMVQTEKKDSNKAKLDSLKVDSNKLNIQKGAKIDEQKKTDD